MDHEFDLLGEFEPDDLEEIASEVWVDGEHFGRVGVRVEIDNDEGVLDGMQDDGLAVTVPKRRTVELHMHLS